MKSKINSISNFNTYLENEYDDLNERRKNWYPIMYYNEDAVLENKNYITVGINPSLSDDAKKAINGILEVDQSKAHKGDERFDRFNNDRQNKKKELIKYQRKLKHNSKYQIPYFKTLEQFFQSIGKNFEEDVFHYDFCQLRNTDSGDVKEWIRKKDNFNLLCTHFDVITELIDPDYVFIFNATLIEILMENDFFDRINSNVNSKKDFQFYNEFMDNDGICRRDKVKFIVGNQLSAGATSRVYRANLIANVKRLLDSKK